MATNHKIVTREEWLAARLELLAAEKELTHRSDSLAQQRQALPWERVEKTYEFDTDEGKATLKDLFKGRSQLLVYHFMFGPDYQAGCPSCSAIADGFNGFAVHLANHDVTLMAVSRAPLAKLQAYKKRLGWTFPWASSYGGEFNYDFNVSITEEQQRRGGSEYNYERGGHALDDAQTIPEPVKQFAARCGTDAPTYMRDRPGMSTFVLEDGVVYHSYSTYARGLDGLWGMYQWLDRAPLGPQRARRLVEAQRRVRQGLSHGVGSRLPRRHGAAVSRQRCRHHRLVRLHVRDAGHGNAGRLDHVDGVDAHARPDLGRRSRHLPRHVDGHDDRDDVAGGVARAAQLPARRRGRARGYADRVRGRCILPGLGLVWSIDLRDRDRARRRRNAVACLRARGARVGRPGLVDGRCAAAQPLEGAPTRLLPPLNGLPSARHGCPARPGVTASIWA